METDYASVPGRELIQPAAQASADADPALGCTRRLQGLTEGQGVPLGHRGLHAHNSLFQHMTSGMLCLRKYQELGVGHMSNKQVQNE